MDPVPLWDKSQIRDAGFSRTELHRMQHCLNSGFTGHAEKVDVCTSLLFQSFSQFLLITKRPSSAVEVKNATFLRVRVGAQFREGGGEAFAVSSVLPYPDWSEYDVNFDVMLLYLVDDVPLRAEAQHVALTPASAPSAGEKLIMTGYGDLKVSEAL